jgi:hypothetical protein
MSSRVLDCNLDTVLKLHIKNSKSESSENLRKYYWKFFKWNIKIDFLSWRQFWNKFWIKVGRNIKLIQTILTGKGSKATYSVCWGILSYRNNLDTKMQIGFSINNFTLTLNMKTNTEVCISSVFCSLLNV